MMADEPLDRVQVWAVGVGEGLRVVLGVSFLDGDGTMVWLTRDEARAIGERLILQSQILGTHAKRPGYGFIKRGGTTDDTRDQGEGIEGPADVAGDRGEGETTP